MLTIESFNPIDCGYNTPTTEYTFTGHGGSSERSSSTSYNRDTNVSLLMACLADVGSRVVNQLPRINMFSNTVNDLELSLSNDSRSKALSTESDYMTSADAFIRQLLVGNPILSGAIGREEFIAMKAKLEMHPDAIALIKSLTIKRETQKLFYFGESDFPNIWVVVDNSDIELEMVYSRLYVDFIAKHPNFNCDFLVLGRDEISYLSIPEEAVMF
jgi:hypothetical protein